MKHRTILFVILPSRPAKPPPVQAKRPAPETQGRVALEIHDDSVVTNDILRHHHIPFHKLTTPPGRFSPGRASLVNIHFAVNQKSP